MRMYFDDDKRITVSASVREQIYKEQKEFKEWKENQRKNERIIEIFGKKLKIIDSDNGTEDCIKCALCGICTTHIAVCETIEHKFNRYFVEIQTQD